MGSEQLLEQDDAGQLVGQRHRPQRQAVLDPFEVKAVRAADHKTQVLSRLASHFEEPTEGHGVVGLAFVVEQADESPLRDTAVHPLVLADLNQFQSAMAGDQPLVVLDVVDVGRAQTADGEDDDAHDADGIGDPRRRGPGTAGEPADLGSRSIEWTQSSIRATSPDDASPLGEAGDRPGLSRLVPPRTKALFPLMRVALLSDIHANRHALEGVLEEVDALAIDEMWCLGDIVGYGAEPDGCCALVRENAAVCLAGNHDLAVTGHLPTDEFARGAAIAADWTAKAMATDHLEWLGTLSASGRRQGIGLFHGSPREPVWEYVMDPLTAALSMDVQGGAIAAVGHSHIALSYHREPEGDATGTRRQAGDTVTLNIGEWILNPGSVGQPRDGDNRAAWLELDLETGQATWRRTAYDIAGAQFAIRAARLPDSLADRLEYGQ